jgi:hypothetical protein
MNSTHPNSSAESARRAADPERDAIAIELKSERAADAPLFSEHYARAKHWTLGMAEFLRVHGRSAEAEATRQCANYLLYRLDLSSGEAQVSEGYYCQKHKLCAVCAIRRGGRLLRTLREKILARCAENPRLRPFLVTFTCRNDLPDWLPAIERLAGAHQRLLLRRRKYLGRGNGWTEAARAEGMFCAMEVKRGASSRRPHPHIHAVWLCEERPHQAALRREWYELTDGSHQVDVRPFRCVRPNGIDPEQLVTDLMEVCKYITKFTSMAPEDVWFLHDQTRRRHFTRTVGALRFSAAELTALSPNAEVDPDADARFVEVVYRWAFDRYPEIDVPPHDATREGGAEAVRRAVALRDQERRHDRCRAPVSPREDVFRG